MKHRLLVLASALLFSTGGAAIKAVSLTSWQVACLRSSIAAITLWLLVPEARKIRIHRLWPAALAYAATLVLYALANKLTTAASATFLQATAPFYLLLIGPLFLKEPNCRGDYVLGSLIAAGMVLFFAGGSSGAQTLAPKPLLGNALAAASGLTWATTVAMLRQTSQDGSSSSLGLVSLGNLVAGGMALPFAIPLPTVSLHDGVLLVYLGVVQIALAYVCLTRGVRHVPAFETSALVLLEPAMNPVWAYLFHGERPGPYSLAGGTVIICATLAHTISKGAKDKPATATPPETHQSHPD
jgi:drug/metabolite transporter (DMT)-like permease